MLPLLACHRSAATESSQCTLACHHPRTMSVPALHPARTLATRDVERNVSPAVLPKRIRTQQPRAVKRAMLSRLACHQLAARKPRRRTLSCQHPRIMRVLAFHRARRLAAQDIEGNGLQVSLPNRMRTLRSRAIRDKNISRRMKPRPLDRRGRQ